MIKDNQGLINRFNEILDYLILALCSITAVWINYGSSLTSYLQRLFLFRSIAYVLIYSLINILVLKLSGFYNKDRLKNVRTLSLHIIVVNLVMAALLDFSRIITLSSYTIAYYYSIATILMIIKVFVTTSILRYYRYYGFNQKHVLLVGNGHLANQYVTQVNHNHEYGYVIDGYLAKSEKDNLGKYLGYIEDLDNILSLNIIDEVVVALEPHEVNFTADIIEACEKWGTKCRIIPFYNDYIPYRPSIDEIGNVSLVNIRSAPLDDPYNKAIKRSLDIILSIILIIITSPVMLFAVIGIKLTSKGPILFKQDRVGYNREPFKMYKFRSMKVNVHQSDGWSKDDDDRKTAFGAFLRKFSIDELPQFFNVLKGDMSLIGPRPEVPYYVDKFKDEIPKYMVKHQVKPGITGWAQVNGFRGDTSIKGRIEFDLYYIDHWSIGLDLKIIILTIFGGLKNSEHVIKRNYTNKNIGIYVATNKQYWTSYDSLYIPLQVGAAINEPLGYLGDNSGDNISDKNKNYCELTGTYWIWKNSNYDYVGLVHYRRYFTFIKSLSFNKKKKVLNNVQAQMLLDKYNVILPKKRHYWIETNYSQYVHAHHKKDLDVLKSVIADKYPNYLDAYNTVMKKRSGHRFNMIIAKKDIFDNYASFIFDVLFAVEKQLDISNYDSYNQRVYGFLGERLLDVWLLENNIEYKEIGWLSLESQHWPKKIYNFLKRKLVAHHE